MFPVEHKLRAELKVARAPADQVMVLGQKREDTAQTVRAQERAEAS